MYLLGKGIFFTLISKGGPKKSLAKWDLPFASVQLAFYPNILISVILIFFSKQHMPTLHNSVEIHAYYTSEASYA